MGRVRFTRIVQSEQVVTHTHDRDTMVSEITCDVRFGSEPEIRGLAFELLQPIGTPHGDPGMSLRVPEGSPLRRLRYTDFADAAESFCRRALKSLILVEGVPPGVQVVARNNTGGGFATVMIVPHDTEDGSQAW